MAKKNSRGIDAYDHTDKQRLNNPPAGFSQRDADDSVTHYKFDPYFDPTLEWSGKAENFDFDVITTPINIHEVITPTNILAAVMKENQQGFLFEDAAETLRNKKIALEAYRHDVQWNNRLIAGDSLVVMNSLLQKEGMARQVQMIYFDPPYGIKYSSNFQPFTNKRDVKDTDDDLSAEPETIKAFRDTWELGIHSYLSYLRGRLLLAKELLADSGSVFVQISDENVHFVRCICDEVFGRNNFVAQIVFQKTGGQSSNTIGSICDYIIWYAKDKSSMKYHQLYKDKILWQIKTPYRYCIENGIERTLTKEEILQPQLIPSNAKVFAMDNCTSAGKASKQQPFEFEGKIFYPSANAHWKPKYPEGMDNLAKANRLRAVKNTLMYKRYFDDFPVTPISNVWNDTILAGFTEEKLYVVQTSIKAVQRCMLMTTDPGDLVMDITCGSGTTAYVAEQWGRRWITCDTSRIAIEIAKARLMTAVYDYYKLADETRGVSSGFIYKTVPHITLKSIANNETPAQEILYDAPEVDTTKARVSGAFTVESLPAPIVKSPDEVINEAAMSSGVSSKQDDWRQEMLSAGIIAKNGQKFEFVRVEELEGTEFLQTEAETTDGKRALICFGEETKVMDGNIVNLALNEAEKQRPTPDYLIFAAFQFNAEAAKTIEETNWRKVKLFQVQMNADLMTSDLKKKQATNQSFWLVGQPDVELVKVGGNRYKVIVRGFDYYNIKTGRVESGDAKNIAMWMLDMDYHDMVVKPQQVFFPMGDGWTRLAKTLRGEINSELIEAYSGNESLEFELDKTRRVAVKIIDDRGIESIKVFTAGDSNGR